MRRGNQWTARYVGCIVMVGRSRADLNASCCHVSRGCLVGVCWKYDMDGVGNGGKGRERRRNGASSLAKRCTLGTRLAGTGTTQHTAARDDRPTPLTTAASATHTHNSRFCWLASISCPLSPHLSTTRRVTSTTPPQCHLICSRDLTAHHLQRQFVCRHYFNTPQPAPRWPVALPAAITRDRREALF